MKGVRWNHRFQKVRIKDNKKFKHLGGRKERMVRKQVSNMKEEGVGRKNATW